MTAERELELACMRELGERTGRPFETLAEKAARLEAEQGPQPIVRVTRYEVNLLPDGVPDRELYGMSVARHADGRWSVRRGEHRSLGADGTWSWGYRWPGGDREPASEAEWDDYHAGQDAWVAEHRFDEETALKLAREAAPAVQVNRRTAADVLRDWQQREAQRAQ